VAFDLFTGLWWPLRDKGPRVPARETAWLVAKLFAWNPRNDHALPFPAGVRRLAGLPPHDAKRFARAEQEFERLLSGANLPREPDLRKFVRRLQRKGLGLDWALLLDDLSRWTNPEECRPARWAKAWLSTTKGESHVH
jgi:hypothetical protein